MIILTRRALFRSIGSVELWRLSRQSGSHRNRSAANQPGAQKRGCLQVGGTFGNTKGPAVGHGVFSGSAIEVIACWPRHKDSRGQTGSRHTGCRCSLTTGFPHALRGGQRSVVISAETRPTIWCSGTRKLGVRLPSTMCRSVRQIAHAFTWTRTWFACGSGVGTWKATVNAAIPAPSHSSVRECNVRGSDVPRQLLNGGPCKV